MGLEVLGPEVLGGVSWYRPNTFSITSTACCGFLTMFKTERCLPVIGQAAGCAVCVKVCPIQRFGVEAVVAYYDETGRILGKDSDDLEGYTWLIDHRYYGVGDKPRISSDQLLHPPELEFDPKLLYEPLPEENVIGQYVASH